MSQRLGGRARQERNRKILAASDICHICGRPGSDAVDHVIAYVKCVALGIDPEDPSNLKPAHHDVEPRCNRHKATKDMSQVNIVRTSRDW